MTALSRFETIINYFSLHFQNSVVVLGNSQNNIKVPLRSDISVSACVVSTNLLYSGFHVIHRAVDL